MLFPALVNFQLHVMTQTSLFRSVRCDQETRVSSQPQKRDHLTQRSLVDCGLKPSSVYMLHRFSVYPQQEEEEGENVCWLAPLLEEGVARPLLVKWGKTSTDQCEMKSDRFSSLKLIHKMSSKPIGPHINMSDQTWEHFVDLVHLPDIIVKLLFLLLFFRNDSRHIYTKKNQINWFRHREILL